MKREEQNNYQELQNLKEEYLNVNAPEQGREQMIKAIEKARREKQNMIQIKHFKQAGLTAAAALALLVITPNVSQSAAMAMSNIPLIGPIVKVVTIRDYKVKEEHRDADVAIPKVEAEGEKSSQAADKINQDVEQYIDTLVAQFKADTEGNENANQTLDVTYETVTDTDTWFTLKLSILEAQASGFQSYRYYHIDKQTGEVATLKDIFREGADYKAAINANIKMQMEEQMQKDDSIVYWLNDTEIPDSNFQSIKDDQNFYFNKDGQLVISFDEYEVAPGYMGAVEFPIPDSVLAGIRR